MWTFGDSSSWRGQTSHDPHWTLCWRVFDILPCTSFYMQGCCRSVKCKRVLCHRHLENNKRMRLGDAADDFDERRVVHGASDCDLVRGAAVGADVRLENLSSTETPSRLTSN